MKEAGLEEVETYVIRHQNTDAQYIATRLILEIFLAEEQHPEARVSMIWWYQAGLNLAQG